MVVKKFIDINSTYRDRLTYPSVGDFVIPTNGTPAPNNPLNAIDPIINSFPYEASLTNGLSTTTQIALNVLASPISNFYLNSYLEINGEFSLITSYNASTQFTTIDPAFSIAPVAITPYTIRFEKPILYGLTSASSVDTFTVYLPVGSSTINGFYVNNYVFLQGLAPPTTYQYYRIKNYDGATLKATIQGTTDAIVLIGTIVQILRYSSDNVKSLKFFGTEVFNNPTCISISLVNLIVPNLPIIGSYGGTIQNYSHLYVALYSEKGITYNNPIINNSPAADRSLFKVPITFLQGISFLTLGYTGMIQTVSFRPNDTLHLSIFLPNGDILNFSSTNPFTYFDGYIFPIPSNPLSQIQAVFEINFE